MGGNTFGESHGAAVGVIVDGVTPGLEMDEAYIQGQMDRRKPGQSGDKDGRQARPVHMPANRACH